MAKCGTTKQSATPFPDCASLHPGYNHWDRNTCIRSQFPCRARLPILMLNRKRAQPRSLNRRTTQPEGPMAACSTWRAWSIGLAGLVPLWMAAAVAPPAGAQSPNKVFLTEVNGVIGVATTRQISQAIQKAKQE